MRFGVSWSVLGYDTTHYANLAERLEGTHCIFEAECGIGSCVAPNVNTLRGVIKLETTCAQFLLHVTETVQCRVVTAARFVRV